MTAKRHPFDSIKTIVSKYEKSLEIFKKIRAGIDDPNVANFVPCTVVHVSDDETSFDVRLAGVRLRCELHGPSETRKPFVRFLHVAKRDDKDAAVLGDVEFNAHSGYTDLRHFTEHEDPNFGDQLQLTTSYGMKELLAVYFLKVLQPQQQAA